MACLPMSPSVPRSQWREASGHSPSPAVSRFPRNVRERNPCERVGPLSVVQAGPVLGDPDRLLHEAPGPAYALAASRNGRGEVTGLAAPATRIRVKSSYHSIVLRAFVAIVDK
jgi:hypothetical protein